MLAQIKPSQSMEIKKYTVSDPKLGPKFGNSPKEGNFSYVILANLYSFITKHTLKQVFRANSKI